MSEELEERLRKILRPVDPGADFTARVMAQVPGETRRRRMPFRKRSIWMTGALAASAVLAVVGAHHWRQRQDVTGLQARAQVIEALRVTSQKLALANRLVDQSTSRAPDHGEAGS